MSATMSIYALSSIGLLLLGQLVAVEALPQALTASVCTTKTSTRLGLAGTSISDGGEFQSSMDAIYKTSGIPFSGTRVFIWTSVYPIPTGGSFTGYGVYDSNVLTKAGFSITTLISTITSCRTAASTTPVLPPSPTGADCSPHGDHWHCDPYPTSTTAGTSPSTTPVLPPSPTGSDCEPHGDHWHCEPHAPSTTTQTQRTTQPPVITSSTTTSTFVLPPSPTGSVCAPHNDHWHCEPNAPSTSTIATKNPGNASATSSSAPPAGTCTPHDSHWHCPEGVPEPPNPPPISKTARPTTTSSPPLPEGTCTPHDSHWHCPEGVPEPPNPPPQTTTTKPASPSSTPAGPPPTGNKEEAGEDCVAHDDHFHCPEGVTPPTSPPTAEPVTEGDEHEHEEATGTECVAHEDHWHCPAGVAEPTSPPTAEQIAEGDKHEEATGASTGTECVAHDDHWHCPEGVATPTYAPGSPVDKAANAAKSTLTTSAVKAAATCTPHDDHWHCPPGVKEPTGKPTTTVAGGVTPIISKVAATSGLLEFKGDASMLGLSVRQIVGSIGLPLLLAALL